MKGSLRKGKKHKGKKHHGHHKKRSGSMQPRRKHSHHHRHKEKKKRRASMSALSSHTFAAAANKVKNVVHMHMLFGGSRSGGHEPQGGKPTLQHQGSRPIMSGASPRATFAKAIGKVVAAKSTYNENDGGPRKFVGRSADTHCQTKSQPNSWMSVDLGEGRAVVPTHYCLRNDSNQTHVLRNWSLQGKAAEPGADWVQIRRHDNDETLAKQRYSVGAWPIEGEARAFRHFRIHQHGPNAAGNDQLMCCGFEVYGTLTEE